MVTARSPDKLGAWTKSPRALVVALDVTNERSAASAIAQAEQRFGSIDVLVNNAGVGLAGPLEAISIAEWQLHCETNFFGVVRVTQATIPLFRKQKHGLIINVSSILGHFGIPFLSPYCAGKFAMEGLSESLRFELRPLGVRVKLVEPGGIQTKFEQKFSRHEAYEPGLSAVMARMKRGTRSLPGPETVAKVIFKAANDSSDRLRYAAKTQGAITINRILPDFLWRWAIERMFGLAAPK